MEAVKYVELNQYGSVVVAGTGTHVTAIGFAHEGGYSEQELLEWFHLSKEQLHGALAYFYGNRESLIAQENESAELAKNWRKKALRNSKRGAKRKPHRTKRCNQVLLYGECSSFSYNPNVSRTT